MKTEAAVGEKSDADLDADLDPDWHESDADPQQ
jgi:hypothetical protein